VVEAIYPMWDFKYSVGLLMIIPNISVTPRNPVAPQFAPLSQVISPPWRREVTLFVE